MWTSYHLEPEVQKRKIEKKKKGKDKLIMYFYL